MTDVSQFLMLAADGYTTPTYINAIQFLSTIVAALLAFFVLGKYVWPIITKALDARDEKIRSEIKAAEDARTRADDALKGYEQSLAEAKAEAQAMIEATKAEQTRLAAELRQQSEAEAQALLEEARRTIAAAKRAAVAEIYNEGALLATKVAEKILERELNAEDQKRLVDETVATFSTRA